MSPEQPERDPRPVEAVCEECGKSATFPGVKRGTVQDCPHCGALLDVGGVEDDWSDLPGEEAEQEQTEQPEAASQQPAVPASSNRLADALIGLERNRARAAIMGMSERLIHFSPRRMLLTFLPLLLLIGVAVLINPEAWRNPGLGVYLAFGGLAFFVLSCCLILPRRSYLRLTPAGLEVHRLLGTRCYPWHEVSNFRVLQMTYLVVPLTQQIIFNLSADSPHQTGMGKVVHIASDYEASFPASFEIKGGEVADLLNQWQRAYTN